MRHDIIEHDEYKIYDKLLREQKKNPLAGIIGIVRLFMNDEMFYEGSNLVIAQGREYVAQKIFNTRSYVGGSRTDLRDYVISHFAIGSGGATIQQSSVLINGPHIGDTYLYQPITLGKSQYLKEPSSYDGGNSDPIHKATYAVKPITTDGSIYLESETYTETGQPSATYYTKVKSTCVIPAGEPSGLGDGQSVQISEAGLYIVKSSDVKMFAHICFPPKYKEKESTFSIAWYTIC